MAAAFVLLALSHAALAGVCPRLTEIRTAPATITDGLGLYMEDTQCEWRIDAGLGSTVQLTVESLSLECGWDFVFVYDGTSETAPLLAALSGSLATNVAANVTTLVSTSSTVLVHFVSDPNVVSSGFDIEVAFVARACSRRGALNVNGTCVCEHGYSGTACETANATELPACASAGDCVCAAGFNARYGSWFDVDIPATRATLVRKDATPCVPQTNPPPNLSSLANCSHACAGSIPALVTPGVVGLALFESSECPVSCPYPCVNGTCNQQYARCVCFTGWGGARCDTPLANSGSSTGPIFGAPTSTSSSASSVRGPLLLVLLLLCLGGVVVITTLCRRRPAQRTPGMLLLMAGGGPPPGELARLFVAVPATDGRNIPDPYPITIEDANGQLVLSLVALQCPARADDDPPLARVMIASFATGLEGTPLAPSDATRASRSDNLFDQFVLQDGEPTTVPPAAAVAPAAAATPDLETETDETFDSR